MTSRYAIVALAVGALASGCHKEVTDYGEALVVVTTDVEIERFANRLRFDVYDEKLVWIASQDVSVPSALDWPVSFSVRHPSETSERIAFVRVRAYPEGALRDYRSEGAPAPVAWSPPAIAEGIPALCSAAPDLPLGGRITLRRGSAPITTFPAYTDPDGVHCGGDNRAGSVAVKVNIPSSGSYSFGVIQSLPDARVESAGAATLSLRRDCNDPSSQIACADPSPLPLLTVNLDAGTYWVVSGGSMSAPADLVLHADREEHYSVVLPPAEEPEPRRLVIGGVDQTPAREPEPRAAIDRLLRVRLRPSSRGTLRVALTGSCLGMPVDLAGGRTCIDGTTRVVEDSALISGIDRTAPPLAPWGGQAVVSCAKAPAAGEVCVRGGAFLLGDRLALAESELLASQPMRPRVVAPFLLDRAEVTVGRYRAALGMGFAPIGAGAVRNDLPLGPDAACTWNEGATPASPAAGIARERFPLNCIDWADARAFCRFFGADLPSEEQWEFAASAEGRPSETQYPWGDRAPDCARAAFGRFVGEEGVCASSFGPVEVDAAPFVDNDVTATKIVGLAGNVAEWTLDGPQRLDHPRWDAALVSGVPVFDATAPLRVVRGSSWDGVQLWTTATVRRARPPSAKLPGLGFRCARAGT